MKMNITMDPKNKKKRHADRTFYNDSDSDYEIRTKTMNWPHFLLVESGDESLPVTKLSPFAIDKGFQALISGRLRSIKRLRNGTFLMECDTKKQSDLLLKSQKLVDRPMIVSIHPTLNSSRGVIRCPHGLAFIRRGCFSTKLAHSFLSHLCLSFCLPESFTCTSFHPSTSPDISAVF